MNEVRRSAIDKYLIGAIILLGIVAGGNSAPSYYLDSLIQLAAIIASGFVIWRHANAHVDGRVTTMVALIVMAVLLQLIPLPAGLLDKFQAIAAHADPAVVPDPATRTISLNIGRTLEALAWVVALGMLTIAISKISFESAYGLVPIFLIGVIFHLVAGIIQYSSASTGVTESVLGFNMSAGFFANSNHFSALVFISIPVAFAFFYDRRRLSLFLVYLIAALLVLLAVGSRAGVMIGLAITILSSLVIFRRGAIGALSVLFGSAIIGIYSLGVWARIAQEGLTEGTRAEFARTTLEGILDNLVFGIGYGNFVTAYPYYEKVENIVGSYVNHAHDDFIEIAFEGGLIAIGLILAFLFVFVQRLIETARWPLHYACALSILFLLVHSVVDYPLRTMAISISFCLLIALLFHRGIDEAEAVGLQDYEDELDILPPEAVERDAH